MTGKLTDKANILCILEILKENSDETHILPVSSIINQLRDRYGLEVERRSVYRNIDTLIAMGYDISKYSDNNKGYYLINREFEESELHFLMDAVFSAASIPAKATHDLIEKLGSFQSRYQRKKYSSMIVKNSRWKTPNTVVFYNIDILDEAITSGSKVQFDYMKYTIEKSLVPRRTEKYTASPYGMVYVNEHYYLICCFEGHDDIAVARIDRIANIKQTKDTVVPLGQGIDLYDAANRCIYMYGYGDKTQKVTLHCDMNVLDDVIDKFGEQAKLTLIDDKKFALELEVVPMGLKYWILQYAGAVEVIGPIELRREIQAVLKCAFEKYQ